MDNSDTMSMQSSTVINMDDDKGMEKIFHLKGKKISATVEEVEEDKHEDDSDFNGSFSNTASN